MNPDDHSSTIVLTASQCADIEAALSGTIFVLETLLASAPLRLHSVIVHRGIELREALDTLSEAKQPHCIDSD